MEFIVFVVVAVLTIIPMFKLLPTYGLNALWSLVCVVPLGLIVLLWIMAARAERREM